MTILRRGRSRPHTPPKKSAALDSMRLDLYDIAPCLHLRVSDRAKRMALRLDAKTGKIHLVIPARASLKKALEFARTHQDWIDRQTAAFPAPVILKNGSILPVLGQNRVVRIIYVEGLKRTSIRLGDKEIIVITNKEDPTGRIIRFLKNLARTEITRITKEKSSLINKVHGTLYIRDTTSRWGSCSQEGNLSFSWRLILAPLESLDYVVAHEVAHLMHMDHGPKFWALCEKLSTDFSTGHKWMKTQGHSLMRYC
ncbi:MAG: M48 family metallopeptidase [Micavibrio sp.]